MTATDNFTTSTPIRAIVNPSPDSPTCTPCANGIGFIVLSGNLKVLSILLGAILPEADIHLLPDMGVKVLPVRFYRGEAPSTPVRYAKPINGQTDGLIIQNADGLHEFPYPDFLCRLIAGRGYAQLTERQQRLLGKLFPVTSKAGK